MLVELGFSIIHSCEKAANDLEYLVEGFGDDIVLAGSIDAAFLATATPEEVRRETLEMLATGSARGRFIASCNTSPQYYIPEEELPGLCPDHVEVQGWKQRPHPTYSGSGNAPSPARVHLKTLRGAAYGACLKPG